MIDSVCDLLLAKISDLLDLLKLKIYLSQSVISESSAFSGIKKCSTAYFIWRFPASTCGVITDLSVPELNQSSARE